MSCDDYTRRQAAKDAEYAREYKAWIESMPADHLRELERQELAAPDLQHHGNGSATGDAADSPVMRIGDDPALLPEPEPETDPTAAPPVTPKPSGPPCGGCWAKC